MGDGVANPAQVPVSPIGPKDDLSPGCPHVSVDDEAARSNNTVGAGARLSAFRNRLEIRIDERRVAKEIQMSTLVAVVFDDETTAFDMRSALLKMQKEYLVEMEDSVVVTRNQKGKTKLDQIVNLTRAGAVGGGFWGMLIGLIFLNPLLGAAVGATAGAISGRFSDIGLDDEMMKELGQSLKPGSSALFVLVRRATGDKVLDGLKEFAGKGRVFRTSLNKDEEESLREALEKAA